MSTGKRYDEEFKLSGTAADSPASSHKVLSAPESLYAAL